MMEIIKSVFSTNGVEPDWTAILQVIVVLIVFWAGKRWGITSTKLDVVNKAQKDIINQIDKLKKLVDKEEEIDKVYDKIPDEFTDFPGSK